ncbi:unnamed protein product [Periconia digitata]|uniref:Uncharacterized protein n=1 Tax=Periconia digitata TaxID=1303443 RepID=A0A9W4UVE6_9PLEO|nr:unnamed protein product [Periconia digitata]
MSLARKHQAHAEGQSSSTSVTLDSQRSLQNQTTYTIFDINDPTISHTFPFPQSPGPPPTSSTPLDAQSTPSTSNPPNTTPQPGSCDQKVGVSPNLALPLRTQRTGHVESSPPIGNSGSMEAPNMPTRHVPPPPISVSPAGTPEHKYNQRSPLANGPPPPKGKHAQLDLQMIAPGELLLEEYAWLPVKTRIQLNKIVITLFHSLRDPRIDGKTRSGIPLQSLRIPRFIAYQKLLQLHSNGWKRYTAEEVRMELKSLLRVRTMLPCDIDVMVAWDLMVRDMHAKLDNNGKELCEFLFDKLQNPGPEKHVCSSDRVVYRYCPHCVFQFLSTYGAPHRSAPGAPSLQNSCSVAIASAPAPAPALAGGRISASRSSAKP